MRAQYEAAVSTYRNKVRTAVKEVEEALVRLQSANKRLPLAQSAFSEYQTRFAATQTLHQSGLGSLLEVETARRNLLTAELAVKELDQERVSAWIALYRAAGGGWENPQLDTVTPDEQTNIKNVGNGENS
jgi:outer membrane protein TolC